MKYHRMERLYVAGGNGSMKVVANHIASGYQSGDWIEIIAPENVNSEEFKAARRLNKYLAADHAIPHKRHHNGVASLDNIEALRSLLDERRCMVNTLVLIMTPEEKTAFPSELKLLACPHAQGFGLNDGWSAVYETTPSRWTLQNIKIPRDDELVLNESEIEMIFGTDRAFGLVNGWYPQSAAESAAELPIPASREMAAVA